MAALSGIITVVTAGTAVPGTATPGAIAVALKAHPSNTGSIWLGNDGAGDVASSNGFPLDPGEGIILQGDLAQYFIDAAVSGEKVCYMVVQRA